MIQAQLQVSGCFIALLMLAVKTQV